jgi:hypothetical protein
MPDQLPPTPKPALGETGIQRLMTSTGIHKHPTAFYSTQLPILEVALNAEHMSAQLGPLLQPLARAGVTPQVSYAKLLAYQQGNRGLIQYEVTGIGGSDPSLVFGKLFPQLDRAERTLSIMDMLWTNVFAGQRQVGVPQPLGCLPELSMLVYVPAEGLFLNEVIAGERALSAMELAGTWLGVLHRHRLPLDRTLHMTTEVANLQGWATLVGQKYPEEASSANHIAEYLQQRAADLPFESDVPIHKDFHYGHIVIDNGLKIIDLDEMRLGDPNFDLAHFCANLHLLSYRNENELYKFSALQRAFLSAYARETGWVTNERFVYFYAYTCLKIAKQLCTLRGLRPRPEGEEQLRQVHLMLEQGLGSVPPDGAKKHSRAFATVVMQIADPNGAATQGTDNQS